MPLPRPMATQEPDLTPQLSPLRAGAPPTSASACRLECAHAHVAGLLASRGEAGLSARPRRWAQIGPRPLRRLLHAGHDLSVHLQGGIPSRAQPGSPAPDPGTSLSLLLTRKEIFILYSTPSFSTKDCFL